MYRRVLLFALLLILPVFAHAGDLGYITIQDDHQLAVARDVFGTALVYIDGRFLVFAEESQQRQLKEAGIAFDEIASDALLSNHRLVYLAPDGNQAKAMAPFSANARELAKGMFLAEMSDYDARLALEQEGLKSRSLSDLKARFFVPLGPSAALPEVTEPPFTDTFALMLRSDSLQAYVARLQNFKTRYLTSDSVRKAADWLIDKFHSFGYDSVVDQSYYVGNYHVTNSNIYAVKVGTRYPDKLIIVGAHYDSYCTTTPYLHAPGADDNASGTAVVLEMARIFKDIPTTKTMIFVAFGAEEIGMFGSGVMASNYAASNADIEMMYNYDMVAYDPEDQRHLELYGGSGSPYTMRYYDALYRLADFEVSWIDYQYGSDHEAFWDAGFDALMNIEPVARSNPHYHQVHDSSTYLNATYHYNIARVAAAEIGYVACAPDIVLIDRVIDAGNGQQVEVFIKNCDPGLGHVFTWQISTWPPTGGVDTLPPGVCSQVIDGLTEGRDVRFSVRALLPNGLQSVYAESKISQSLVYPRQPAQVVASPGIRGVHLDWADNNEADLNHYSISRSIAGNFDFTVLAPLVLTSSYIDNTAQDGILYEYIIAATDNDGHTSDLSQPVIGAVASFHKPILIADEMATENEYLPGQQAQEGLWDTIFNGYPHEMVCVDSQPKMLLNYVAGQYKAIYWFDDDISIKLLDDNAECLDWYLGFPGTNMLLAGFNTITAMGGANGAPGSFLWSNFYLDSYIYQTQPDFIGATPSAGWPALEYDKTRGFSAIGEIPTLNPRPGAEVIYRYDGKFDIPGREGTPIGLAYSGREGKRILLAFPIYYLTPQSAQALIVAAQNYFASSGSGEAGDIDGSGSVDIGDLGAIIDFLFFGQSLSNPQLADVNDQCGVDIGDLVWFVDYLFFSGPSPLPANCGG